MSDVLKFTGDYKRPRTMTAREIWAQPEPPDAMVWEMCVYTRGDGKMECVGCPASEHDTTHGAITKGCRGLAAEACRVVMAMQAREPKP